MTCPFDRAQALEQRERDQAIAAALARARSTGASLTHCKDCDDEIPGTPRLWRHHSLRPLPVSFRGRGQR